MEFVKMIDYLPFLPILFAAVVLGDWLFDAVAYLLLKCRRTKPVHPTPVYTPFSTPPSTPPSTPILAPVPEPEVPPLPKVPTPKAPTPVPEPEVPPLPKVPTPVPEPPKAPTPKATTPVQMPTEAECYAEGHKLRHTVPVNGDVREGVFLANGRIRYVFKGEEKQSATVPEFANTHNWDFRPEMSSRYWVPKTDYNINGKWIPATKFHL